MKKPALPIYKIERRPLAKLVPYAKNARTHSLEQVEQIAASIREWGWTFPILVDEKNGIIAGHGRALAAKELGAKDVPVIVAAGWTAAQKQAYVLADNKLAENAGWDRDLLKIEIGELGAAGFDLSLAGFSGADLASIVAWGKTGLTDPDDVPEPRPNPAAQAGDVWLLGVHRLVCGDCTGEAAVRACVGEEKPHLMVTDPPYGVSYDPNWRNEPGKLNLQSTTAFRGRKAAKGKVQNDDRSDWTDAWRLFPGDVAYVWHGERQGPDVVGHFRECGFEPRNLIVWAKDGLVISRGHYHPQHEGCWYFVRAGATGHWNGDRKQSTLWEINRNIRNETGHGTQKPVECMRRPIVNNSKPGDAVYDPFLGSGTTLIAAEMEARRCLSIEIDPVYCDVAIRRWQDFTGNHATREATGERFGEKVAA